MGPYPLSGIGASGGGAGSYDFRREPAESAPKVKEKKKGGIVDGLKDYFTKNRDLIYSVGLIILIDHFIFKGAFREKIKDMVDSFCMKTHKMIEASHKDDTASAK